MYKELNLISAKIKLTIMNVKYIAEATLPNLLNSNKFNMKVIVEPVTYEEYYAILREITVEEVKVIKVYTYSKNNGFVEIKDHSNIITEEPFIVFVCDVNKIRRYFCMEVNPQTKDYNHFRTSK